MEKETYIRKANSKDLPRIAEIQVFNYRLYFYPIFKMDEYFFHELSVPALMKEYASSLDSLYVYDDGAVKGKIATPTVYGPGARRGILCLAGCWFHAAW